MSSDPAYVAMLAGAGAGGLARVFVHPLDTVKARLQVQTRRAAAAGGDPALFRNTVDALRRTAATEGVRGLYRGFGVTFFGSMPAGCIYFTTYEASKSALSRVLPPGGVGDFANYLASGLLAEALACVLFVPVDVVKERLQVQNPALGNVVYRGSVDAVVTILRQEGLRGIYRGYGATLLSFGPFTAFYFLFYEQCKRLAARSFVCGGGVGGGGGVAPAAAPETQQLPTYAVVASAATAGALASFFTNPLDLVKLRMQVQRGCQAQVAAGGGGSVAQSGAAASATASAASAAPSSSAARAAGALQWPEYQGMAHGLRLLLRSEGLAGALRGVGARMAFHVPSTTITFTVFEEFKTLVRRCAGLPTA